MSGNNSIILFFSPTAKAFLFFLISTIAQMEGIIVSVSGTYTVQMVNSVDAFPYNSAGSEMELKKAIESKSIGMDRSKMIKIRIWRIL